VKREPSSGPVCYDPFSYEVHEDPYPIYRRLRDESPAYHNAAHDFWALSRYHDVRRALKDHDTFCSSRGFLLENIDAIALPMIIGMDPPDHTRVRATINRALTPRRVTALEQPIRARARSLLDALVPLGRADVIADFAAELPMTVIAEMLSVPEADRARLRAWADRLVHRDDKVKGLPADAADAGAALIGYFHEMVAALERTPGDDLLTMLLAAERDGEISRDEILGFCFLLIIAGNETTTKLVGNMVYQLSRHPDQRRRLLVEPTLIPKAVEETLRYDTSTHMMARTTTRDIELHGRTIPSGSKVALLLASANRDERQWMSPEIFDVGRDTTGHLAFGVGIHHCLGAALARMEATVSLSEMLARIPDFEVVESGLRRVHSGNVRGYAAVPIVFTPGRPNNAPPT